MSGISRRDFLTGLTAASVGVLTARYVPAAETTPKIRKGSDLVALGRTGLKTTVLGIGTGTNSGKQQRDLGFDGFTKLVRHALDRGIQYIDTADSYKTHPYVAKALEGVPRDKYFIQSKTFAKQAEAAKAHIERFRQELRVDYIDTLLMHCMTKRSWPTDMRPVMDAVEEAKRLGHIRAYGVSCHGWDPLVASVETDWPEVQLVRINPFGDKMDGPADEVAPLVKKMHAKGRGVIGMKIYGETGFGGRQQRLESLKYVFGLGCVDCFTIGFTSIAQLDETMDLIEQALA